MERSGHVQQPPARMHVPVQPAGAAGVAARRLRPLPGDRAAPRSGLLRRQRLPSHQYGSLFATALGPDVAAYTSGKNCQGGGREAGGCWKAGLVLAERCSNELVS